MPGADENTQLQPGAEDTTQTTEQTGAAQDQQQAPEQGGGIQTLEQAMDEIKKLRAENAKHRNRNKELDSSLGEREQILQKMKHALGLEEETDPAEHLEALAQQNQQLQVELTVKELVQNFGVPNETEKYFRFLLSERLESLEEGEELTEDEIEVLAQEARKIRGGAVGSSTGLSLEKQPNASAQGTVSAADFAKMGLSERSQLYTKNPALYQKLFDEAQAKRLL
jgi:hypothetical protein